jgi:hypothetical protein
VSKNVCPKCVSKFGVPKVQKKTRKKVRKKVFKGREGGREGGREEGGKLSFQCLRPSTSLMAAGKNVFTNTLVNLEHFELSREFHNLVL